MCSDARDFHLDLLFVVPDSILLWDPSHLCYEDLTGSSLADCCAARWKGHVLNSSWESRWTWISSRLVSSDARRRLASQPQPRDMQYRLTYKLECSSQGARDEFRLAGYLWIVKESGAGGLSKIRWKRKEE